MTDLLPVLSNHARRPLRRFLAIVAPVLCALWIVPTSGPAGAETGPGIRWIDVGQGSAALVIGQGGEAVMIDSGPPAGAEAIVHALARHNVQRVQLWVHTHHDADHLGGVARVVLGEDGLEDTHDDIEVATFWDRGLAALPETSAVTRYLALAGQRRQAVERGARWVSGGLEIEVVLDGLDRPASAGENARGIALCVRLAGTNLLAPGDLPAARVAEAAARCRPVDILWASHHGARDGLDAGALVALEHPPIVVITAGMDNIHCHPSRGTLALLSSAGITVLMTGAGGLDPRGACPSLAASLRPTHHIEGGDIWLALPG